MSLAATVPERVRALILADPVPPAGLNAFLRRYPGLLDAAYRTERAAHADRGALIAAGRRRAYLAFQDELDRRSWLAKFEERPDGTWAPRLPDAAFRAIVAALGDDLTRFVDRVRCSTPLLRPTFTVSFWPRELADVRRLPALEERRVSGDHSFVQSNPAATVAGIRSFLSERADPL